MVGKERGRVQKAKLTHVAVELQAEPLVVARTRIPAGACLDGEES